jgi:hypothetical protein
MTHLAVTIDEKEKFDDEMSEVSSISLSESHRDDERERYSQRDSRASCNRLLTHSQRVTNSLATSSLTSRSSSRSSSSLSATLSLCKKIFTDSLQQSIQNQLLQMKLESQAQKIQLKKTKTD